MHAYFAAALAFVYAHWQSIAFGIVLLLSAANRLLPGHPRYSGFVRQAVSLLAATPMAGARSAIFAFAASRLGDGLASAIFDWLSRWLDIPLLSASVTPDAKVIDLPPRGFSRPATLAFLIIVCCAIGCASIFGATAKRDVIDCGKEALKAAAADAAPQVSIALTGGSANWRGQLADLEQHAGDAVLCAVAALVRGFEQAHAHEPAPLLTVQPQEACAGDACAPASVEVHLLGIDRGRDYLVGRAVPVEPILP